MRITAIIDIGFENQECIEWLIEELEEKGMAEAFDVKDIKDCRGMEFPAVVTISAGLAGYASNVESSPPVIDSWTRVTSSMSLIHVDNGFDSTFKRGLEDAMKDNVAKKAEEQDVRLRDFHRKYAYDQHGKDKFFSQALKKARYLAHCVNLDRSNSHLINRLNNELVEVQNEIMHIISDLPSVFDSKKYDPQEKAWFIDHTRSSWADFIHGLLAHPQGCQWCQKIQKKVLQICKPVKLLR